MGVLVLAVLGMDLAAWAWERAGSNFFHTQGRVFIGVNAATSSHGGDANAYLQVHNPESNPNNMEVARFTARVGAELSVMSPEFFEFFQIARWLGPSERHA